MSNQFQSYDVRYSKTALSEVIKRLEHSLLGVDRDLQIMASLSLAIGLSDPTLLKEPDKFSNMLNNLSRYLCWAVQLPEEIEADKAN